MAPLISGPYLILPFNVGADVEDVTTIDRIIMNLFEKRLLEWKNVFKGHEGAWCVGSSHGWLMLLDKNGCPSLLNPPSSKYIQLPPFSDAFMQRARISHSYFVQYLLKTFVSKAVLMHSPSPSHHTTAILFSYPCRLAFCTNPSTWVELSTAKRSYCDIVFQDNNLYALTEDGTVEKWDVRQQVPTKIQDFDLIMERDVIEETYFLRDGYSSKMYLVVSEDELLLVKRIIGDFVNADGVVVYEGYELPDGRDEICPYRTKYFVVYKLDSLQNKWVKKSSLGDRVLFVGNNGSKSLSAKEFEGCEANSIYFTDDRREEMSLDYSYGGHDWGVFSFEDKTVKLLIDPCPYKMDPPPVWVV